jgi:hypothetical protein
MVFPQTPLDAVVELNLAGTWTDITSFVYDSDRIQITRGRSDWASRVDPSTARMRIINDGRFSPKNPVGPYYGQLGRNTPLRVYVNGGSSYLDVHATDGAKATTTDKASISVTGDIDIRIEFALDSIPPFQAMAGKYSAAVNQRSWALYTNAAGTLFYRWSANGTAFTEVQSTATVPLETVQRVSSRHRQAIRVTHDVDNGAAGNTVTFYRSDSITGAWVQVGAPVVTAAVTSIFDSTAALDVGETGDLLNTVPINGRIFRFELRNGIGGTVVANPDFTAQTAGVSSFSDTAASANTWSMVGTAEIANRHYRFHGEVPEWPVSWEASGNDVWTQIEASGILRRLGRGESLRSAMTREFSNPTRQNIVAYWPCEDVSGSALVASRLPGGLPGRVIGAPDFGAFSDFVASDPLPTMQNGSFTFPVGPYAVTTEASMRVYANIPASGPGTQQRLFSMRTSGTASRWEVDVSADGNSYRLRAFDRDDTVILTDGFILFSWAGRQQVFDLELTQSGADIDWRLVVFDLTSSDPTSIVSGNRTGTLAGQTFGKVTTIIVAPDRGMTDVATGHVVLANEIGAFIGTGIAMIGWLSETAGRRVERLCSEEGITFRSIGDLDDSEPMGVQTSDALLNLLQECADADLGILYEPREVFGLGFRTRSSLYNQPARIELDYAAEHLSGPLNPVDDDQQTRNDVTASRKGGSSARVEIIDGPLSVQDPPDGVGRYDDDVTVNVDSDLRLPDQASWRGHLGTADEARYPALLVNLAASPVASDTPLTESLLDHEIGDRLTADNPPAWLPPDQISQLVQGYSETLGSFEHQMTLTATPESPYRVGVYDSAALGRYDTAGSELAAAIDADDTILSVATTSGPLWTYRGLDMPFDIVIGGEVMAVDLIGDVLNLNPYFGTDVSDWSVQNATSIVRSTAVVHPSGVASMLITPNGSSATGGAITALTGVGTVTAGRSYIAATWLYIPTGYTDLQTAVDWYDSGGVLLSTGFSGSRSIPAATWTPLTTTLVAPASASQGRLRVRLGTTPPATALTYAWNAQLIDVTDSSASPQQLRVIRGVNAVHKSHSASAPVSLADPVVYAL